jgi:outer membrane lipoprotein-sorting protein
MTFPLRLPLTTWAFWLAAMMLLGIVSGCATRPTYQQQVPAESSAGRSLFDDWQTRRTQYHSLQGVAKVRVQTPERTINGTQVILAEEPGRLRAETLSPFGTPLLVMVANETEFAVLVPGDNHFYRGWSTPENLSRFTRLPLHLADLVSILLSKPPLIAHDRLEAVQTTEGGWLIILESGQRRQELRFDAAQHLTMVQYLSDAKLQLRLVYGEFDGDALSSPHRIELQLPQQQIQAALIFKELEMNRQILPDAFTLVAPANATVTLLDEPPVVQDPLPAENR